MGVESKIRELLSKGREDETLTEEVQELEEKAGLPNSKDVGDKSNPTQGSSNANPEKEDLSGSDDKGGLTSPVGKAAAGKASKDNTLPGGQGAGEAPNYSTTDDPKSVVNQGSSKGNVHQEEVEEDEALEVVAEEEVEEVTAEVEEIVEEEVEEDNEHLFEADIEGLFSSEENLTEDFKVKAAEIFEAMVVARVSNEMDSIRSDLEEETKIQQETFKEEMVEKIDSFLSYVAENWMKENELAIERGLRTEITEDFIGGLKTLFAEHYIAVPEEKYDVLGEMQDKIEQLESKLNESVEEKMSLTQEKQSLQRQAIVTEACADLTLTEAEKFAKLVEDIEFGDVELFSEKVGVVKENYFPKQTSVTEDKLEDTVDGKYIAEDSTINRYAQAISKSVKF